MEEFIQNIYELELKWEVTEIFAVLFSILYVILAAKEKIWCWAAAIISVSLYIYICFNAKLYAETGLQIFYLIMAIYGYISWNQKNQDSHVIEWSEKRHLTLIAIGAICTFFLGFYFDQFTDAKQPIVDSFTTVFSVLATYMVIKKVLENWLYWIVVDLAAVYLYFSRDLHLTALLFIVYTVIAIFGYISWSKSIKNAN